MHLNFEKIPILGASALILSMLPLLFLCTDSDLAQFDTDYKKPIPLTCKQSKIEEFTLPLTEAPSLLSQLSSASQIEFSLDPPRPSSYQTKEKKTDQSNMMVRLPKAKQIKRVTLPAKLNLSFNNGKELHFGNEENLFWIECALSSDNQVKASLFVKAPDGELICKEQWVGKPHETPLLTSDEIPNSSPFKSLAESKWWGLDLFAAKFSEQALQHRIEIGQETQSSLVELQLDEWLVFKDEKWQKAELDQTLPIARVKSHSTQELEIEGWEGSSHIRFKIPQILSIPLKTKGEELFSQLRIRSDKQISCVIDKQCLILRTGDWVLRGPTRWKVLRKKEEKEAFLTGNITGDLFVLDRIDAKSAVKSIGGQLFSLKRSQAASLECSQAAKNTQGSALSKGAGKIR